MNEPAQAETPYVKTYYAHSANPAPARPALQGDVECDVCVLGAGFSGISTALHLAEKGLKVVVLEAAKVGWGASGRNGGQIINGYSRDFDAILSRYGETVANDLLGMSFEGGDIIRAQIDSSSMSPTMRYIVGIDEVEGLRVRTAPGGVSE